MKFSKGCNLGTEENVLVGSTKILTNITRVIPFETYHAEVKSQKDIVQFVCDWDLQTR